MAGPTYTYTSDTPQSPNPMNQTQPVILANFQAINELISVNHGAFNTTNFGKHNFISLLNTTAPGTDTTEIAMFTAVTGSPNPCELFIQYPSSAQTSQLVVQLSAPVPTPSNSTGTSGGNATQGWVTFPSGILFRWGTVAISTVSVTVNLTGTIPTNNIYCASMSPYSSGCLNPLGSLGEVGYTLSQVYFVLYAYSSPYTLVNFNYLFIGM
jgi:hypothetical protein